MRNSGWRFAPHSLCLVSCLIIAGCAASASKTGFFGKAEPPQANVLRYITGDEPESIDPHKTTGQPETRILMALYEGLVEYDPKTMDPIPAIAEHWDENDDSSELRFYLRKNARWSNGDPITAKDFVYSFRRALNPATRARGASLGYYLRYAEAYNSGAVFVRDPQTNTFLLAKDFGSAAQNPPLSEQPGKQEYAPNAQANTPDRDTPFHQFMHSPMRLTLPGDEKARNKLLAKDGKLQAAVAGKEFVKVTGEALGIEAVDDYTVRIALAQSAPFFKGLLANQLFRLVPQKTAEQYAVHRTD